MLTCKSVEIAFFSAFCIGRRLASDAMYKNCTLVSDLNPSDRFPWLWRYAIGLANILLHLQCCLYKLSLAGVPFFCLCGPGIFHRLSYIRKLVQALFQCLLRSIIQSRDNRITFQTMRSVSEIVGECICFYLHASAL